MKDQFHETHVTRVSIDASSYDEICINCGATDIAGGGWGKLALPCPKGPGEYQSWHPYRGDFNSMTDKEVDQEYEIALREMEEAESWIDAVHSWKRAGKPRKPIEGVNYEE